MWLCSNWLHHAHSDMVLFSVVCCQDLTLKLPSLAPLYVISFVQFAREHRVAVNVTLAREASFHAETLVRAPPPPLVADL